MISLTYAEVVAIDKQFARRVHPQSFDEMQGSMSQTAGKLFCSRSTVKKWVRRHRQNLGL